MENYAGWILEAFPITAGVLALAGITAVGIWWEKLGDDAIPAIAGALLFAAFGAIAIPMFGPPVLVIAGWIWVVRRIRRTMVGLPPSPPDEYDRIARSEVEAIASEGYPGKQS